MNEAMVPGVWISPYCYHLVETRAKKGGRSFSEMLDFILLERLLKMRRRARLKFRQTGYPNHSSKNIKLNAGAQKSSAVRPAEQ
jgi:predicted CopG family antitoxin